MIQIRIQSLHVLLRYSLSIVLSTIALLELGCQRQQAAGDSDAVDPGKLEAQVSFEKADVKLLFVGNSHTSAGNLPELVRELVEAESSFGSCYVEAHTGGMFLADHRLNSETMDAIKRPGWTAVILQAQKYSTTGQYTYPTEAAEEMIELVQQTGGRVILFPEWRHLDHGEDEAERIQQLHESIAKKTGAEVAPVGLAWDRALQLELDFDLHAPDRNHAAIQGAYLTACVITSKLLRENPIGWKVIERCDLSSAEAEALQQAAWEVLDENADSRIGRDE